MRRDQSLQSQESIAQSLPSHLRNADALED